MEKGVSNLEQFLAEFRPTLPATSGTAQAIDRHAPIAQVVYRAIDDGLTEFADRLGRFMEACLRRGL
jgi:hypothetical protein